MAKSKYGLPQPKKRREFVHNLFLLAEGTRQIVENGDKALFRNFLLATFPYI